MMGELDKEKAGLFGLSGKINVEPQSCPFCLFRVRTKIVMLRTALYLGNTRYN